MRRQTRFLLVFIPLLLLLTLLQLTTVQANQDASARGVWYVRRQGGVLGNGRVGEAQAPHRPDAAAKARRVAGNRAIGDIQRR